MVKTKKQINKFATVMYAEAEYGLFSHSAFVEGYTEAQKEMMKYKKAYEILNCYFDSISDEEQPKVAKQLAKLAV